MLLGKYRICLILLDCKSNISGKDVYFYRNPALAGRKEITQRSQRSELLYFNFARFAPSLRPASAGLRLKRLLRQTTEM